MSSNNNNNVAVPLLELAISNSPTAEQGVLGAILLDNKIASVLKIISARDFYFSSNKLIFYTMCQLHNKNIPIDTITLTEELEVNGELENAGGYKYIIDLAFNTPSSSNIKAYAEIVKNHSLERLRAKSINKIIDAKSDPKQIEQLLLNYLDIHVQYQHQNIDLLDNVLCNYEGYDSKTDWLIKGIIPDKCIGMLYGSPNSFKTFLALDWAACVATGKSWDSAKVTQCGVLYIMTEGQAQSGRRVLAWCLKHDLKVDELFRYNRPVDMSSYDSVTLLINTALEVQKVHNVKIGWIVIDTLARCFGSGNENSVQDMTIFLNACHRINYELDAGSLIVHHTGKDIDKGARGSSALTGEMGYEYFIKKYPNELKFALKPTKARDFSYPETKDYALCVVDLNLTDEDNQPITSLAMNDKGSKSKSFNDFSTETDKNLRRLIAFMQEKLINNFDGGINHLFLKDEVFCWHKDKTDSAKKMFFGRLMKKAIEKGYLYKSDDSYYLTVTSQDVFTD